MANYAKHVSTKTTPQSEPVRGKRQVKNNAGGFVFQVDDWTRLHRFLILGNADGTYYATEKAMTKESADCIDRCVEANWRRTVDKIVEVSHSGAAAKNDPAIFALAYVAGKYAGTDAGKYALSKLNDVCRIGTHLFDFLNAVKEFRGWGDGLKKAVSNWYNARTAQSLASQVTKYRQRNGWSHRDVLRKCHAKATGDTAGVLQYVAQHEAWTNSEGKMAFLEAVDEAQTAKERRLVDLITEFKLVREHIPTDKLNSLAVWEALLQEMPLTALVRNLGKMSSIGLLKPLSQAGKLVCGKLQDADEIKRQRLHPVTTLIAQRTYSLGHGVKGSLKWNVVPQVVDALEGAFFNGFAAVEPTHLNYYLAVDCSGSMIGACIGASVLRCIEAAACMALLAAKTEPNYYVKGFSSSTGGYGARGGPMVDIGLTRNDTITSAAKKALAVNWGGTDCALPMLDALERNLDVDVFCIYTDNETWAGTIHPFQALLKYRRETGRNAKLAVFGMTSSNFSIADPSDAGMMDFCGFDAGTPPVLANFVTMGVSRND